jgi:hypothetical protein
MPDHSLAEEPTTAVIDSHYRRLQEIWSGAHRQWDLYDSYYFRTYSVWDGPAARKRSGWLKPARPTSIVDHAVDHQLAAEPLYHRWPTSESEPAKEAADRVEKAMEAMAAEQALLEPGLTWKSVGKNLTHLGYAVLETGLDPTVLQKRREDPERESDMDDDEWRAVERLHRHYRRTAMPFRTRVPHPARILMDPWEKRPRLAIRHFYRFAQDIEDLVRARQALGKKTADFVVRENNPFERFLVDEWWTDYYHAYMLSGVYNGRGSTGFHTYNANQRRMIFIERNSWGFVPYGHAFAGFGQEPTMATKIDPKYMAIGILDSVIPDLKAQAQAINARHNAVIDASYQKILTSELSAEELRDQLDQGDILEARGDSITRMQQPTFSRWMFAEEEWLSDDIEDGTFSRILGGRKVPGQNTVGQTAIFTNAAGRKFVGLARQLEHLASANASHQLQLIDLLDLDITVRGNRIKASDLDSDYAITATFDVVDPVAHFQNRELGLREVQAGVKSLSTYWAEDVRLADATGERRRLLEDQLRANPLIHQELALEVAREMGVEVEGQRAIDREKQAAGGGMGAPQGPPGLPGGGGGGGEDLNQALTGDVINPDRRGQNLEG